MEDRRLAAIMFTDIVGYTSLMGSDEKKAFELLRKNRLLQKPIIKKYGGKWLKEIGDGILASFTTTSDAVRCAIEIQVKAKKSGVGLRIGIHEGEVVFVGSDVLGDGVNVSSRLEEMAEAGSIYISGTVYKNVKNKEGIETEFIGEKTLKNVDDPVRVYKVRSDRVDALVFSYAYLKKRIKSRGRKRYYIIIGLVVIFASFKIYKSLVSKTPDSAKTIAVLPFSNDSPDEENEYFCNGMMDEILNHLQNISDLGVKSRTAVEPYRNNPKGLKEVARELKVSYILEGSVRKYGNRFRITAQLIDARSGNHVWADTYDGVFSDTIFLVQDNIAKKVALSLNAVITPDEKARIEHVPTTNIEAYDDYIRGRYETTNFWKTGDKKHLSKAHAHLDKALQIDPLFIQAIVEKGNAFYAERNIDSTFAYAKKAITLDPGYNRGYGLLGECYVSKGRNDLAIANYMKAIELPPWDDNWLWYHAALGRLYLNQNNDVVNALTYLQKGLEINNQFLPNVYPLVIGSFITLGDYDQAEKYIHKSLSLEVNCSVVIYDCWINVLKGNFDDAIGILDSLCQDDNCLQSCLRERFQVSLLRGDYVLAERYFNQWEKSGPHWRTSDLYVFYQIGYVYDKLDRPEEAGKVFEEQILNLKKSLDETPEWSHPNYLNLSRIYAYIGNHDEALVYLRKYAERGFTYGWHDFIKNDPFFEKLHNDAEFKSIVKKAREDNAALRVQIEELEKEGTLKL